VCKEVSYPYKTTDRITVLHILAADGKTKDYEEV
jgi:hypothetical protein